MSALTVLEIRGLSSGWVLVLVSALHHHRKLEPAGPGLTSTRCCSGDDVSDLLNRVRGDFYFPLGALASVCPILRLLFLISHSMYCSPLRIPRMTVPAGAYVGCLALYGHEPPLPAS